MRAAGRRVRLIVHPEGELLGPFDVPEPWWPETASIVEAARRATGRELVVLRLIERRNERAGGDVTYLAEDSARAGVAERSDDPCRMSWARPGGALADVDWARGRLACPVDAVQVKSWNLSSLWRLDGADNRWWLKVVPPFFAHEGRLVVWLRGRGHPVPAPVDVDGPRLLMAHVDGTDGFGAGRAEERALIDALVDLQLDAMAHVDNLVELGVPDWRVEPFTALASATVEARAAELNPTELQSLRRLVADIAHRLASAAAAGVPDSIVHGDPHPGNARFADDLRSFTILDWGDATIGCPFLDLSRMASSTRAWLERWSRALPGADVDAAWRVVRPLAALRDAVVYEQFCDNIEPSERVYHDLDVAPSLRQAARLAAA
ncbi:MAG: aminoglycoside phosphotransferase family protein [Acidimicrobiia bacterium]|nr:aminoglycoside phosphotransferase family protein [Acidimicrobiia bacterium]